MHIGGIQKSSLIDYPGKVASVIFTAGCNFRCFYCHNAELVEPELIRQSSQLNKDEISTFSIMSSDFRCAMHFGMCGKRAVT